MTFYYKLPLLKVEKKYFCNVMASSGLYSHSNHEYCRKIPYTNYMFWNYISFFLDVTVLVGIFSPSFNPGVWCVWTVSLLVVGVNHLIISLEWTNSCYRYPALNFGCPLIFVTNDVLLIIWNTGNFYLLKTSPPLKWNIYCTSSLFKYTFSLHAFLVGMHGLNALHMKPWKYLYNGSM